MICCKLKQANQTAGGAMKRVVSIPDAHCLNKTFWSTILYTCALKFCFLLFLNNNFQAKELCYWGKTSFLLVRLLNFTSSMSDLQTNIASDNQFPFGALSFWLFVFPHLFSDGLPILWLSLRVNHRKKMYVIIVCNVNFFLIISTCFYYIFNWPPLSFFFSNVIHESSFKCFK